ncbi:MAG: ABC transporter ATP-binding protein/permease [Christensenellaceae bacterium]|nr:ABC transporter ATP-binding protein/permease [Christensenellaceae bacterium]
MLKKLASFIKGKTWIFTILAPLAMLGEVAGDLALPTLMTRIVDGGVANGDMGVIFSTGLTMLVVAALGALGGIGCTALASLAAMRFGAEMRKGLFDSVQGFSFAEIDRFSTSSLITRLTNDVTQVQGAFRMMMTMLVRVPLLGIGGLIMAMSLSLKLSLIFLGAVPLLFLVAFLIMPRAFPMFAQMQKRLDRLNNVMRENLLGVRVVKAFVGQAREKARFSEANQDLMNWSIKAMKTVMTAMPAVMLVMNLSVLALLSYGGVLVGAGELEVGKIMAFMTYLTQVLFSLMMATMMLMNFSRAKISAERIVEVMETSASIVEPALPRLIEKTSVEFKSVSFRYNEADSDYVLKDLSFKAEKGQTIGIIGGTGSGKSSLISLIPRLYDVSEGQVLVGGVDVREASLTELRQKVGVVLQDSLLFSGSIEENLRWGAVDAPEELLERALAEAQASEFVDALSEGLGAHVEQRGRNFSGGQKQRLSIARSFARDPDILILDDSTSAVDLSTEARIQEALARRSSEDGIVFIIAQRVSAILRADQILVLDEGRLSGLGTHEELLKTNEIYRNIAVSQLGEEVLENAR